jgi:hypothetical protein
VVKEKYHGEAHKPVCFAEVVAYFPLFLLYLRASGYRQYSNSWSAFHLPTKRVSDGDGWLDERGWRRRLNQKSLSSCFAWSLTRCACVCVNRVDVFE